MRSRCPARCHGCTDSRLKKKKEKERKGLNFSASYHLHVALQLADASPLALCGAYVTKVMD